MSGMTEDDKRKIFRLKWIGRKRFKALTEHYGSVEELKQASLDSLMSVPYIRSDIAAMLKKELK